MDVNGKAQKYRGESVITDRSIVASKYRHRVEKCAMCGQILPPMRLGVRLSPVLMMIFDRVQMAGEGGITGRDLRAYMMEKTGRTNVRYALNVRVYALNDLLDGTGTRVTCRREGGRERQWIYYLAKD